MSDAISRADAIRWVKTECNQYGKPTLDYDSGLMDAPAKAVQRGW